MEEGKGRCRKLLSLFTPLSDTRPGDQMSVPPWAEGGRGHGTGNLFHLGLSREGPSTMTATLTPLSLLKLNHSTSETKSLHRSLTQAQDRKLQLEEEIAAYEERMKKLNVELKKLQCFQQQSEIEVRSSHTLGLLSCPGLQGPLMPPKLTEPFPLAKGFLLSCRAL